MNRRFVVATTEEGLSLPLDLGMRAGRLQTSDARVHLQKPEKEVSI